MKERARSALPRRSLIRKEKRGKKGVKKEKVEESKQTDQNARATGYGSVLR